jgi:hypothetical protein
MLSVDYYLSGFAHLNVQFYIMCMLENTCLSKLPPTFRIGDVAEFEKRLPATNTE